MTDHGNESERTANGANQSANGGPPRGADARRQLSCSPERPPIASTHPDTTVRLERGGPAPPVGGWGAGPQRGNRTARRRSPQAINSGSHVW
jgi:hypothetical protein